MTEKNPNNPTKDAPKPGQPNPNTPPGQPTGQSQKGQIAQYFRSKASSPTMSSGSSRASSCAERPRYG